MATKLTDWEPDPTETGDETESNPRESTDTGGEGGEKAAPATPALSDEDRKLLEAAKALKAQTGMSDAEMVARARRDLENDGRFLATNAEKARQQAAADLVKDPEKLAAYAIQSARAAVAQETQRAEGVRVLREAASSNPAFAELAKNDKWLKSLESDVVDDIIERKVTFANPADQLRELRETTAKVLNARLEEARKAAAAAAAAERAAKQQESDEGMEASGYSTVSSAPAPRVESDRAWVKDLNYRPTGPHSKGRFFTDEEILERHRERSRQFANAR